MKQGQQYHYDNYFIHSDSNIIFCNKGALSPKREFPARSEAERGGGGGDSQG